MKTLFLISLKLSRRIVCLLLLVFSFATKAESLNYHLARALLNDISVDEEGFFTNTSSNGYFILDGLNLQPEQACGLSMTMVFERPLQQPAIFELYWRTPEKNYSEVNKAFFIVDSEHSKTSTTYLISLCRLINFAAHPTLSNVASETSQRISELRFDYPANKKLAIKFESITVVSEQALRASKTALQQNSVFLTAYERLAPYTFTQPRVATSVLLTAASEGLSRFKQDWLFMLFWILLVFTLALMLVKSLVKKTK